MYLLLVAAHSLLRWLVLARAAWATRSAMGGARDRRAFARRARLPGVALSAVADIQLLLGLSLWLVLSPHAVTSAGRSGYWTFFHPLCGLTVVALVHVGSVRIRRKLDDAARWRTAIRFYGAAVAVALVAIPWPFLGTGRPLLPF